MPENTVRSLPPDRAWSMAEAAIALEVTERTLRRWVKKGDVPSIRIGRKRFIPDAAMQSLVRNGMGTTGIPIRKQVQTGDDRHD